MKSHQDTPSGRELALGWINGWIHNNPGGIPLSEGFTHTSPYGTIKGKVPYLETVKALSDTNVVSLKIVDCVGDEETAAVWFEMETAGGTIQVCDWVKSSNGVIVAVQSFYDPRKLGAVGYQD